MSNDSTSQQETGQSGEATDGRVCLDLFAGLGGFGR